MGRKPHEPTKALRGAVTALVSFGIPQEDIAIYIGIDPKTLRKHYEPELNAGRVRANAAVIANFWKIASGDKGKPSDQIRAAVWYLERLSGLELGPPRPASEDEDHDDDYYHGLPDAELAKLAARGRKRAPARSRKRWGGPVH